MARVLLLCLLALSWPGLARAEERLIPNASLEALGYALVQLSARGAFRVTGPDGASNSVGPPKGGPFRDLWSGALSDHTGDGNPELIVVQRVVMGSDSVHVFTLEAGGIRHILTRGGSSARFRKLAPGAPLPGFGAD
jgi:hypothetical protein